MADQSSRHAGLATYRRPVAGTGEEEVELYQPRLRTRPTVDRYHQVTAGDRLDLIADRYLGDPHIFWLIADANPDSDPGELLQPGRKLAIGRQS